MYDIICDTPVNYETWSLEEKIYLIFLFSLLALCVLRAKTLGPRVDNNKQVS